MARLFVTVWFSITALVGPGVCCCKLAIQGSTGAHSCLTEQSPKESPPPSCCGSNPTPIASCCDQESEGAVGSVDAPSNGTDNENQGPTCPCRSAKNLKNFATSLAVSIDEMTQTLENFQETLPFRFLSHFDGFPLTVSPAKYRDPHPVLLSGRKLLSLLQTLSC